MTACAGLPTAAAADAWRSALGSQRRAGAPGGFLECLPVVPLDGAPSAPANPLRRAESPGAPALPWQWIALEA